MKRDEWRNVAATEYLGPADGERDEPDMAILVYYPGGPARVGKRYTLDEVIDLGTPSTDNRTPWAEFDLYGTGSIRIRRDSIVAVAEVPESHL